MAIFILVLIMPRLYDPLLVMVYADEAVQALLKGDLVNVIVNQNNTNVHTPNQRSLYTEASWC